VPGRIPDVNPKQMEPRTLFDTYQHHASSPPLTGTSWIVAKRTGRRSTTEPLCRDSKQNPVRAIVSSPSGTPKERAGARCRTRGNGRN
jgi:hypothetical protein